MLKFTLNAESSCNKDELSLKKLAMDQVLVSNVLRIINGSTTNFPKDLLRLERKKNSYYGTQNYISSKTSNIKYLVSDHCDTKHKFKETHLIQFHICH